jgi:hypothetical protein
LLGRVTKFEVAGHRIGTVDQKPLVLNPAVSEAVMGKEDAVGEA